MAMPEGAQRQQQSQPSASSSKQSRDMLDDSAPQASAVGTPSQSKQPLPHARANKGTRNPGNAGSAAGGVQSSKEDTQLKKLKSRQTLRTYLEELRSEDPRCIFIVRRINKLGFRSKVYLERHFSQYGKVAQVCVAHSKVKPLPSSGTNPRTRPGNFGLVVMESPEMVFKVLEEGTSQTVAGVDIYVHRFEQQAEGEGGDESEDLPENDFVKASSGGIRERDLHLGGGGRTAKAQQDETGNNSTASTRTGGSRTEATNGNDWARQDTGSSNASGSSNSNGTVSNSNSNSSSQPAEKAKSRSAPDWWQQRWARSDVSQDASASTNGHLPQALPTSHSPQASAVASELGRLSKEELEQLTLISRALAASKDASPQTPGSTAAGSSPPLSNELSDILGSLQDLAKATMPAATAEAGEKHFSYEQMMEVARLVQSAQLRLLHEGCMQKMAELSVAAIVAMLPKAPGLAPAPADVSAAGFSAPTSYSPLLPGAPPAPMPGSHTSAYAMPLPAMYQVPGLLPRDAPGVPGTVTPFGLAAANPITPSYAAAMLMHGAHGQPSPAPAAPSSSSSAAMALPLLQANLNAESLGAGFHLPQPLGPPLCAPPPGVGFGVAAPAPGLHAPGQADYTAQLLSNEPSADDGMYEFCESLAAAASDCGEQHETLRNHLTELRHVDPNCIFITRRIHKLGFRSREIIMEHFSQYGTILRVLVAHSKVKSFKAQSSQPRTRPGGLGIVVMQHASSVAHVLSLGDEQLVSGISISVQRFQRPLLVLKTSQAQGQDHQDLDSPEPF
eukprot:TRINITY_DN15_c0_g1_i1.p1 TRINITY_DN15_c0_g1~~TRINITY_DN15_c0_g1_i1.p1  ORF type:complete len:863 (+),score=183.52 TRINITY_DN15_c0_g1_i1:231-2591(+)